MREEKGLPRRQAGQVILILILVMTVALAIGISVVQRSLSDISTSSKVEQSGRAFSAAEAGIEKAIQSDSNITTSVDLGNNSVIQSVDKNDVPASGQALEYPPISKEELAQVWLANPADASNYYTQNSLEIYWGNSTTDKPAIEVTIVYFDSVGSVYVPQKFFYDPDAATHHNGFTAVSSCGGCTTGVSGGATFQYKTTLSSLPANLKILRARLLYNSTSQPFAAKPVSPGSLPIQARIFTSTGTAGDTQRKVQVFRLDKVVPFYFDYALFSVGSIDK